MIIKLQAFNICINMYVVQRLKWIFFVQTVYFFDKMR